MALLKKEQLMFAAQALAKFGFASHRSKNLSRHMEHKLHKEVLALIDSLLKDKITVEKGAEKLNHLIEKLNNKFSTDEPKYPLFSFENLSKMVGEHIFAFQHYLKSEIGHISFPIQEKSFNEAMNLWQSVYRETISPTRAIQQLSTLINKINLTLPQDEHYPLPEEGKYQL